MDRSGRLARRARLPRPASGLCASVAGALALALLGAGCGPSVRPPLPPDGALIALGGGPGGGADACFACHGFNGEGDGAAPRLAGLPGGYLLKQLDDYAAARRRHPDMDGVARRLKPGDRRAVAGYYALLAPADPPARGLPALYAAGDPARGLRACAECHGAAGRGEGQAYPPLAGQPAEYLARQLMDWRQGRRWNDPLNVMADVARRLTEAEIHALSRDLSAMP